MKRYIKTIKKVIGVTLLEILLVLAIAAMIIIMSIRYYQSSITGQQTNQTSETLIALVAAADSIALPKGSYKDISDTVIAPLMPSGELKTPWGAAITVASPTSPYDTLDITLPAVPVTMCAPLFARINATENFETTTTCGTAAADMAVTYKRK